MLLTVLFCSTLGLVYAVGDYGYNYQKSPTEFNEIFSPPQCDAGYYGQYPNCFPSYYTLPPSAPPPLLQCPSGSYGIVPYCEVIEKGYLPQPQEECPSGSFGRVPFCQIITTPSASPVVSSVALPGASPTSSPVTPPAAPPATSSIQQCTGSDCAGSGEEEGFGGPKTDSEVSFKLLQSSVG